MSNKSKDIPTLKKAVKTAAKQAKAELRFTPNDFQQRTKAKFYRRLSEMSHHYDKETAFNNPDIMCDLAGTDRIIKWLEDPTFATWFVDSEYVVDTISGLQENAISVIQDVLRSDDTSDGDRIKAARLLLELGDMFPGRKSEVRFLDERVNNMSLAEADKEIAKLKAQMPEAQLPSADADKPGVE